MRLTDVAIESRWSSPARHLELAYTGRGGNRWALDGQIGMRTSPDMKRRCWWNFYAWFQVLGFSLGAGIVIEHGKYNKEEARGCAPS